MALVAKAWGIDFKFRDLDKNTSTVRINYADTVPFTTVETDAGVLAAVIGNLSDAVLVGYTLTRPYEDNVAPLPAESSDVERKGYFSYDLTDGRFTSFSVPSIKNTLVINQTNIINQLDPLVAALIAALGTQLTDSTGIRANGVPRVAEKRHIKSRKG